MYYVLSYLRFRPGIPRTVFGQSKPFDKLFTWSTLCHFKDIRYWSQYMQVNKYNLFSKCFILVKRFVKPSLGYFHSRKYTLPTVYKHDWLSRTNPRPEPY